MAGLNFIALELRQGRPNRARDNSRIEVSHQGVEAIIFFQRVRCRVHSPSLEDFALTRRCIIRRVAHRDQDRYGCLEDLLDCTGQSRLMTLIKKSRICRCNLKMKRTLVRLDQFEMLCDRVYYPSEPQPFKKVRP